MRVFHGISNQAGQPIALVRALRDLGVDASSYTSVVNKFKYESDIYFNVNELRTRDGFSSFFQHLVRNFDIFHFHASSILSNDQNSFPTLLDLSLLKQCGKKVVFHFRGSEARIESVCREKNPYHFYDLDDFDVHWLRYVKKEKEKIEYIRMVCSLADKVYVTDPEVQTYVPNSKVCPRVCTVSNYESLETGATNDTPLIVHAPSKRGIKGTANLISAIDKLKTKGLKFDFQLVENVSHSAALQIYSKADIIVDQLRIGWYGVLAVEGFALKKPVVSYIRKDLLDYFSEGLPLINTNIEDLEKDLEKLLLSKGLRDEYGKRGFEFLNEVHAPQVVAQQLINDYKSLLIDKMEQNYFSVSRCDKHKIQFFSDQVARYYQEQNRPINSLARKYYKLIDMIKKLPLEVTLKVLWGTAYSSYKRRLIKSTKKIVNIGLLPSRALFFLFKNGFRETGLRIKRELLGF